MPRSSFLAPHRHYPVIIAPAMALNTSAARMAGCTSRMKVAATLSRRCAPTGGSSMAAVAVVRGTRFFSASSTRRQVLDISVLPERIVPHYQQTQTSSLLSLHWPRPPRNILLMPKLHAPHVTISAVEFAKHIHANYPGLNLVFESHVAESIHETLPFPIYTTSPITTTVQFPKKIDLVTTMGGDGTILRAASLFSMQSSVPPILSFSMGTLGFLGEWKFDEYKRAWRECYMSGSPVAVEDLQAPHTQAAVTSRRFDQQDTGRSSSGWDRVRGNGKSMGPNRTSKILLRNRLRVGIYDSEGRNVNQQLIPTSTSDPDLRVPTPDDTQALLPRSVGGGGGDPPLLHAINEVSIDRGVHPHLAIIDIYVNNHFLTEAVADGILVSTPTGSTAYSLSAGGSIVHPLVKSLLITPISPRSLSFRPLVLPLNTKVVLKLSKRNRGRELPVSIDGKRRVGVSIGMEVRVEGEKLEKTADGWRGGVPCVIRGSSRGEADGIAEDDDSWVGGLNGLLKFNYPFGDPGQVH
ncbi:ATP-NAD kinase-like domain-containing protein [Diplogelasinospora grovesii]|uniref:ATP-NAD kinase-like domain-containing protein n=1 Tax=Diplogelasinospora grovesii TaxID=303347 RepID=A0AAN6N1R6_9PEZI|nr:ATP-NAD kinase-like domain-containing protein [Diplogelasinospora grovesii]